MRASTWLDPEDSTFNITLSFSGEELVKGRFSSRSKALDFLKSEYLILLLEELTGLQELSYRMDAEKQVSLEQPHPTKRQQITLVFEKYADDISRLKEIKDAENV